MPLWPVLVLLALFLTPFAAQSAEALDPAKVFAYDPSRPVNLRIGSVETRDAIQITAISYDSPKRGRVPGNLIAPAGNGPFAGIVYMHWGQGNKSERLAEGLEMAKRGTICLAIDAPFLRPDAPQPAADRKDEAERDDYIQMVVDLRRAVDVLVARKDIDPKRIGYVGHSLGATWGGPLAAVEKRIKVFVLMGGLPSLSNFGDDDSLVAQMQRASTPKSEMQQYAAVMQPYNPENFVARTGPAKIYFQWAQHDMYISRRSADEYYHAVGGPKEQHWYFTSHEFNDAASSSERRDWLIRELGLHKP